jgi:hypothetical protein
VEDTRAAIDPDDVTDHGASHSSSSAAATSRITSAATVKAVAAARCSCAFRTSARRAPAPRMGARPVYLLLKALLSGAVIAAASEIARRSSLLGAVLISLPLTSILAAFWLYRDTRDTGEVADLSWSILWVIVPSLVFFVVLPLALRSIGFWPALGLACTATALGYAAWIGTARLLGFNL